MKILKRGIDSWSMEIDCTKCLSVLEIDADDVRVGNVSANPGIARVETQPFVSCPVCNHYQTFDLGRVPPQWVLDLAESKRD